MHYTLHIAYYVLHILHDATLGSIVSTTNGVASSAIDDAGAADVGIVLLLLRLLLLRLLFLLPPFTFTNVQPWPKRQPARCHQQAAKSSKSKAASSRQQEAIK